MRLPQALPAGTDGAFHLRLPMANHYGRAGGFLFTANKLTCSFKDASQDPIGCVVLAQEVDMTSGHQSLLIKMVLSSPL